MFVYNIFFTCLFLSVRCVSIGQFFKSSVVPGGIKTGRFDSCIERQSKNEFIDIMGQKVGL